MASAAPSENRRPSARDILNALPDPVEHLKIGAVIGEGAYGKVFKGLVRSSQEIVAVKIVPITSAQEVCPSPSRSSPPRPKWC